mgnify:CR=1 FL=1
MTTNLSFKKIKKVYKQSENVEQVVEKVEEIQQPVIIEEQCEQIVEDKGPVEVKLDVGSDDLLIAEFLNTLGASDLVEVKAVEKPNIQAESFLGDVNKVDEFVCNNPPWFALLRGAAGLS